MTSQKLHGYKTDSEKLRWMLRDAYSSLDAMRMGITADKGLLWRGSEVINLPEADRVASAYNFHCAEALVRALSKWKGEGMNDQEFLDYCMVHSQTERRLFSVDQLQRLYALAGKPFDPDIYTIESIGGTDFAQLSHLLAAALVRAANIRDHA